MLFSNKSAVDRLVKLGWETFVFTCDALRHARSLSKAMSRLPPSTLDQMAVSFSDRIAALTRFVQSAKQRAASKTQQQVGVSSDVPMQAGQWVRTRVSDEEDVKGLCKLINNLSRFLPEIYPHATKALYTSASMAALEYRENSFALNLVWETVDKKEIVQDLLNFDAFHSLVFLGCQSSEESDTHIFLPARAMGSSLEERRVSDLSRHWHSSFSLPDITSFTRFKALTDPDTAKKINQLVSGICFCGTGYACCGRRRKHECEPPCVAGVSQSEAIYSCSENNVIVNVSAIEALLSAQFKLGDLSASEYAAQKKALLERYPEETRQKILGRVCRCNGGNMVRDDTLASSEPTHFDPVAYRVVYQHVQGQIRGDPHSLMLERVILENPLLAAHVKKPHATCLMDTTQQTAAQMYQSTYTTLHGRVICGMSLEDLNDILAAATAAQIRLAGNRALPLYQQGFLGVHIMMEHLARNVQRSLPSCIEANESRKLVTNPWIGREGIAPHTTFDLRDLIGLAQFFLAGPSQRHFGRPDGECTGAGCYCRILTNDIKSWQILGFLFGEAPPNLPGSLLETVLANIFNFQRRSKSRQRVFDALPDIKKPFNLPDPSACRNGSIITSIEIVIDPSRTEPVIVNNKNLSNSEYLIAAGLPVVTIKMRELNIFNTDLLWPEESLLQWWNRPTEEKDELQSRAVRLGWFFRETYQRIESCNQHDSSKHLLTFRSHLLALWLPLAKNLRFCSGPDFRCPDFRASPVIDELIDLLSRVPSRSDGLHVVQTALMRCLEIRVEKARKKHVSTLLRGRHVPLSETLEHSMRDTDVVDACAQQMEQHDLHSSLTTKETDEDNEANNDLQGHLSDDAILASAVPCAGNGGSLISGQSVIHILKRAGRVTMDDEGSGYLRTLAIPPGCIVVSVKGTLSKATKLMEGVDKFMAIAC